MEGKGQVKSGESGGLDGMGFSVMGKWTVEIAFGLREMMMMMMGGTGWIWNQATKEGEGGSDPLTNYLHSSPTDSFAGFSLWVWVCESDLPTPSKSTSKIC